MASTTETIMEPFIGVKLIKARHMNFVEALDKGYKVSSIGEEGYEVEYDGGYLSWSPKKPFEDAYVKLLEEEHPILRFFAYQHLPVHLQSTSRSFWQLAKVLDATLPQNEEKDTAFRKLLEAKDCAVRAKLT